MNTRRSFLQQAAVLSLASTTAPAFLQAARPRGEQILVVLQLTGGNDGLNTVVPYADEAYYNNRFTLGIPKKRVLKLDDHVGLHPVLTGFESLFQDGDLAVLQGVGYPNPNRSHFSSMDIWHTAQLAPGPRDLGWVGRGLDELGGGREATVSGLHLSGGNERPRALLAERVHVPSVDSLEQFRLDPPSGLATSQLLAQVAARRPAGNPLLQEIQGAARSAIESSQQVQAAIGRKSTGAKYPASRLADRFRTLAQLIDAGLDTRVYYVTLNGFDTHANQAGAHAALLKQAGDATAAFLRDVQVRGHGKRVTVLTFSEFGRRVRENGTRGTDHGTAAPVFLAGASVKGGVYGDHPSLTNLDRGDLKFHTDFRRVYATVLSSCLGVPPAEVLGGRFEPLPVFA